MRPGSAPILLLVLLVLLVATFATMACDRVPNPPSDQGMAAPQAAATAADVAKEPDKAHEKAPQIAPEIAAEISPAKASAKTPEIALAPGATLPLPKVAFKEFQDRLKQYLVLREKVESGLPRLTQTRDPQKIADRAAILAAGIREARKGAKPGDVFTPVVAAEFRRIFKNDAAVRSPTDKANIMAEVPETPPTVNGFYPTDSALPSFPPNLFAVLPELPDVVEYRFLGRALVLRDASANLIVDYLPGVAPGRAGGVR